MKHFTDFIHSFINKANWFDIGVAELEINPPWWRFEWKPSRKLTCPVFCSPSCSQSETACQILHPLSRHLSLQRNPPFAVFSTKLFCKVVCWLVVTIGLRLIQKLLLLCIVPDALTKPSHALATRPPKCKANRDICYWAVGQGRPHYTLIFK